MPYRLSKIYTRTGDKGSTSLGDGLRVEKDSPRIEAIGAVDELNSSLGLVLAQPVAEEVRTALAQVQNDLFDLGGELSIPGRLHLTAEYAVALERTLDHFNASLPPLKEFILPDGGPAGAACHLARAVCRRAERRLVTLARAEGVNPHAIAYLNRLSDLLFVIARLLTRAERGGESYWLPGGRIGGK